MALTDTGKDIQVIIGTGVPRASDMVYGGIAIDENGKIYTKNKNGSVVVVGEVNKVASSTRNIKITSNYTAPANSRILVDCRSRPIVVKLASNPATGTTVEVVDIYRKAKTNKIVIDRNGKSIHKANSNDSIECDGGHVKYIYIDSTWVVVS